MDTQNRDISSITHEHEHEEDTMKMKKGQWTLEEDAMLIDYVSTYGEGRWNSAARLSELQRSGKSCRLRWLNYLNPDVKRGNITLQEQLLIIELHSRWGNRWSKIAQHLPGRTDNEIKNYWRTRVQKHAKQLRCDVNSKEFRDAMRYVWVPRLIEQIRAESGSIISNNDIMSGPSQLDSVSGSMLKFDGPNLTSGISGTSSNSFDDVQVSCLTNSYDSVGCSVQNESDLFVDDLVNYHESIDMGSVWNDENIWFL